MKKIILLLILLVNISCASAQKDEDIKLPDYFYNISQKAVENIQDPSHNLNLVYSDFMIIVEDYDVLKEVNISNYEGEPFPIIAQSYDFFTNIVNAEQFYFTPVIDTIYLYEDIMTEKIFKKKIKIIPLSDDKDIHYKVYVAMDESLTQMLPLEEYHDDDAYEKSELLETWREVGPYKKVNSSKKLEFRIPSEESLLNIKDLKKQLALRDTLVTYEGELYHYANYVYKGLPTEYLVEGVVVKIEKYKKEHLIETKYLRTYITYGC